MRVGTSPSNGRRTCAVGVTVIAITVAAAGSARAQSPKVAAEALFEEGRKLIAEGKPALACPKLVESERLDPSPSTLLNLASCYEKLGKTASAWATYKEAASLAYATGRTGFVAIAQKHAAVLEPSLVRLAIRVPDPAADLEIKRDGLVVGRGEWDVAIPVDPGTHRVEASAPDHKTWVSSIDVAETGKTSTLTVPPLERAPAPPPQPRAAAPVAPMPRPAEPSPRAAATTSPQKTIGLVTGGVGVVGLAVGTVFVLMAKAKYDDSRDHCPNDPNLCTPDGVSLRDEARRDGNVATVAYGAGAAALVTGAVLFFTAPSRERSAGVRVTPTASGVLVDGRF